MKLKVTTAKKAGWKVILYLAVALIGVIFFLLVPAFQQDSLYNKIMTSVLSVFLILLLIIRIKKYLKKEMIKKEIILKDVEHFEELKE